MKIRNAIKKIVRPNVRIQINVNHVSQSDLLQEKMAVITGGGSGIGLAIAKKIIGAGGGVILVGRNKNKLHDAYQELKYSGPGGIVICDVANYGQCIELPQKIHELLGINKIDILVNSAGTNGTTTDFFAVNDREWDTINDINLRGAFFISQAFIKEFIENKQKAHILNICSSTGFKGAILPYGISKWGMVGMTEGLGRKFAKDGIIINGIAPGATATEMMGFKKHEEDLKWVCPSGRVSIPDEIGNLAVFMCSDMGANMVGEVVSYDGGERMINMF